MNPLCTTKLPVMKLFSWLGPVFTANSTVRLSFTDRQHVFKEWYFFHEQVWDFGVQIIYLVAYNN